MKKAILAIAILSAGAYTSAQTNQINNSGNVGIGTTNPGTPLEVVGSSSLKGNVVVDSTIIVRDSILIDKDAKIGNDLRVEGKGVFDLKLRTRKNLVVDKDAIVRRDLIMEDYADDILDYGILFLDEDGKTYPVDKAKIKPIIDEIGYRPNECFQDPNGNVIYVAPTWHNIQPNTLYTGVGNCENFAKVGINTNAPQGYLHIKGYGSSADDRMLVIENNDNPNGNPILLQFS